MNNCMKELIPGCTSYYARHSVASIAAELDVPLDTIAVCWGTWTPPDVSHWFTSTSTRIRLMKPTDESLTMYSIIRDRVWFCQSKSQVVLSEKENTTFFVSLPFYSMTNYRPLHIIYNSHAFTPMYNHYCLKISMDNPFQQNSASYHSTPWAVYLEGSLFYPTL